MIAGKPEILSLKKRTQKKDRREVLNLPAEPLLEESGVSSPLSRIVETPE